MTDEQRDAPERTEQPTPRPTHPVTACPYGWCNDCEPVTFRRWP